MLTPIDKNEIANMTSSDLFEYVLEKNNIQYDKENNQYSFDLGAMKTNITIAPMLNKNMAPVINQEAINNIKMTYLEYKRVLSANTDYNCQQLDKTSLSPEEIYNYKAGIVNNWHNVLNTTAKMKSVISDIKYFTKKQEEWKKEFVHPQNMAREMNMLEKTIIYADSINNLPYDYLLRISPDSTLMLLDPITKEYNQTTVGQFFQNQNSQPEMVMKYENFKNKYTDWQLALINQNKKVIKDAINQQIKAKSLNLYQQRMLATLYQLSRYSPTCAYKYQQLLTYINKTNSLSEQNFTSIDQINEFINNNYCAEFLNLTSPQVLAVWFDDFMTDIFDPFADKEDIETVLNIWAQANDVMDITSETLASNMYADRYGKTPGAELDEAISNFEHPDHKSGVASGQEPIDGLKDTAFGIIDRMGKMHSDKNNNSSIEKLQQKIEKKLQEIKEKNFPAKEAINKFKNYVMSVIKKQLKAAGEWFKKTFTKSPNHQTITSISTADDLIKNKLVTINKLIAKPNHLLTKTKVLTKDEIKKMQKTYQQIQEKQIQQELEKNKIVIKYKQPKQKTKPVPGKVK